MQPSGCGGSQEAVARSPPHEIRLEQLRIIGSGVPFGLYPHANYEPSSVTVLHLKHVYADIFQFASQR
jgi:hypothetical protein